jgi:deazaflavin-dependent oxidoreductase (nitroreductase family)
MSMSMDTMRSKAVVRSTRLSTFLATLVGRKMLVRCLSGLNVAVYRCSQGRLMNNVGGTPICLVTMTGRKTGKVRTLPLMCSPRGEDVLLVASLGGAAVSPAWYYNLKVNPRVRIQIGARKREMVACEATAQERAALWPIVVANFPSFTDYQKKTARILPIMICTPA